MGYFTTVALNLTVKKEKIEDFQQRLEEIRTASDPESHWFRHYTDLAVNENGALKLGDNYRKWYDGDRFNDFVKEFVTGGDITGYGDEFSDYWRIAFDGQGNWKAQIPVFVDENAQQ